jgi:hypothetical protein
MHSWLDNHLSVASSPLKADIRWWLLKGFVHFFRLRIEQPFGGFQDLWMGNAKHITHVQRALLA